MEHCQARDDRRELIADLRKAVGGSTAEELDNSGTEGELLDIWSVLVGVVAEYTDGGDQMAENCTCSDLNHVEGHPGERFGEILRKHQERKQRGV